MCLCSLLARVTIMLNPPRGTASSCGSPPHDVFHGVYVKWTSTAHVIDAAGTAHTARSVAATVVATSATLELRFLRQPHEHYIAHLIGWWPGGAATGGAQAQASWPAGSRWWSAISFGFKSYSRGR